MAERFSGRNRGHEPFPASQAASFSRGRHLHAGEATKVEVNVRLIAATNRDIIEAIRDNHFREDLFHRLNVVQFRPPLRERGDDIILLDPS